MRHLSQQLRDDIDKGNIEKAASGEGQDKAVYARDQCVCRVVDRRKKREMNREQRVVLEDLRTRNSTSTITVSAEVIHLHDATLRQHEMKQSA